MTDSSQEHTAKQLRGAQEHAASLLTRTENPFFLSDGGVIHSMDALRHAAKSMSQEVFDHHVNKEKNDFANWIEHVFKDNKRAWLARRAQSPTELVDALTEKTPMQDDEVVKIATDKPIDMPAESKKLHEAVEKLNVERRRYELLSRKAVNATEPPKQQEDSTTQPVQTYDTPEEIRSETRAKILHVRALLRNRKINSAIREQKHLEANYEGKKHVLNPHDQRLFSQMINELYLDVHLLSLHDA